MKKFCFLIIIILFTLSSFGVSFLHPAYAYTKLGNIYEQQGPTPTSSYKSPTAQLYPQPEITITQVPSNTQSSQQVYPIIETPVSQSSEQPLQTATPQVHVTSSEIIPNSSNENSPTLNNGDLIRTFTPEINANSYDQLVLKKLEGNKGPDLLVLSLSLIGSLALFSIIGWIIFKISIR